MITFLICVVLLIVGYMTYGKFVDKVFAPDDRPTPAIALEDGVDYVPMDTITISYKDTYKISQHLVRTSHAYPNSVIAIYKPNGTFLTSTLTTSPTDNIAANKNNFSKQSIIDIYTNKRILITNQNSYKNYSIS